MSGQYHEEVSMEQMAHVWGGSEYEEVTGTDIGDGFCARCGRALRLMRDGTYKCFNSECSEFNKRKSAEEVAWR